MKKLIIYHADYCGPCRRYIAKVLPEIKAAFPDQVEERNAANYLSECRRLKIQHVPAAVLIDGDAETLLPHVPSFEEAAAFLAGGNQA